MNFGTFAGGLSLGLERGRKLGGYLQTLIRENGLQKLRDAEMAKAQAESASKAQALVHDNSEKVNVDPQTGLMTPLVVGNDIPAQVSQPTAPVTPEIATTEQPASNTMAEPNTSQDAMVASAPAAEQPAAGGQFWWNSDN